MDVPFKPGNTVAVSNYHGTKDYMVTSVSVWGEVTFKIVCPPSTKIGRLRFPETITIKLK